MVVLKCGELLETSKSVLKKVTYFMENDSVTFY